MRNAWTTVTAGVAAVLTAGLWGAPAQAALVSYQFTAVVSSTFGIAGVQAGQQVQGRFSLETDAINVGTAAQAIFLQPATTEFAFEVVGFAQDFGAMGRVEINDNIFGFDRYLACAQRAAGSVDVEDACLYFLGADLQAITDTSDPLPPVPGPGFSLVALDYRLFGDGGVVAFLRADLGSLNRIEVPAPSGVLLLLSGLSILGAWRRSGGRA